ncbi:zinc-finger-containing protein [Bacillus badius]|uniref:Phage protein n=1 Tax=Bacillus badius TaxID=1455 RepID=A0ABR5ANL5_BACBA|nr:zinc-finger-containing protein [Bacillus badius]KIL72035.1 hypothetical protein SD77_3595 [Bacillus badius]MED4718265.1 zinc-finger-containing protein [Bacillus badius]
MNCPYCDKQAVFLTSKEFYGRDYGSNVYLCRPCDAYVGTHGNTKNPLGTMATPEVRRWRKAAHSIFDPLWRSREMSRSTAYRWMQEAMGLSSKEAHIALFDEEQCKQLIEKVKEQRGIKHV